MSDGAPLVPLLPELAQLLGWVQKHNAQLLITYNGEEWMVFAAAAPRAHGLALDRSFARATRAALTDATT